MREFIIQLLDFMVNKEISAPHLDVNIDFTSSNGYRPKSARAVLDEQPSEATVPVSKSQTEN